MTTSVRLNPFAAGSKAPRIPHGRAKTSVIIHIIGCAVMGLLAALKLAQVARKQRLDYQVVVYEPGAIGGGADRAASPKCQAWKHSQGVMYAITQPHVALGLQPATAELERLAPASIARPLALAIEPAGSDLAAAAFQALGIAHWPVPERLLARWLPQVKLPPGHKVFRTLDGTLDLTTTAWELKGRCERLGVRFVHSGVEALALKAGAVGRLRLGSGEAVSVRPDDVVILACGAGIRPLLLRSHLAIPGLRLFRSTLAAAPMGIPALLAVLLGGVNCVPHTLPTGELLNIFGDSGRVELPPETDGDPVELDARAVKLLCDDVADQLGLRLRPSDCLAWPGVKTEIVAEGSRSQAHHAFLVPGLTNVWIAIPGKLSQAA